MDILPVPLFCLTLAHSIDDVGVVERFLSEYPDETQTCIPIALRTALESKDLPPVPFFSNGELLRYLKLLWEGSWFASKLGIAVNRNLIYLVSHFLNAGVSVHIYGDSALRVASKYGYNDIISLLLDRKANVHAVNDDALQIAAREGHVETVRLLLDRKANVHADSDVSIRLAAIRDDIDMIDVLLDRGANIHAHNNQVLVLARDNPHRKLGTYLQVKGIT